MRDKIELFTKLSGEDGLHTSIGRIVAYLDGYERGKSEIKWIPCSERLPEENMLTICQNNAGAMMIGKYDIEFGWIFPAYFDGTVAWMPLPELYREGE